MPLQPQSHLSNQFLQPKFAKRKCAGKIVPEVVRLESWNTTTPWEYKKILH